VGSEPVNRCQVQVRILQVLLIINIIMWIGVLR
jgi:hypothetical protein